MQLRVGVFLMMLLPAPLWGQGGSVTVSPSPPAKAPLTMEQQNAQMKKQLSDWPQLEHYRTQNASLAPAAAGERRVVFFGDSITDIWGRRPGTEFFPGKPYVNRGISGQTTPQMLVRFEQDVVQLKPAAVLILAGTNDIAGKTGPATLGMIEDNFESMIAIARANGIKVVVASILPASHYYWAPEVQQVPEQIRAMNERLKAMCVREKLTYVDYYTAMTNASGGLDPELSADGVHPTAKGFEIMAPLAQAGIDKALGGK